MADIRLAKPAAGTSQNIVCDPEARFIFDFSTGDATLSRSGDHLVFTFEDGSTLQLENFYTAYSKENMPSFEVDGAEIAGEDFFMAMNEPDLMPAAGPARADGQSNGNRFHDYVNADLLDGLDRLGGLDIGWPGGDVNPDTDGAAGTGDINYPVFVTPGDPQGGGTGAVADRDILSVQEAGLRGEQGASASASGYMSINAPDGVASIVIDGVVVFNGALTGAVVPTDEGYLEVTGFDASTGRLDYTYHLTQSTQEHSSEGNDQISHDLVVTVTDTDGSTGSGVVSVVITDDVPSIESFSHEVTEGEAGVAGDALEGAVAGADGADFAWDANQSGRYGEITLNADGTYSYRLDNDNAAVKELTDGETLTEEFTYTYTDADGDIDTGSVTITISGKDNGIIIEPSDPVAGSDEVTVYESGLANGSQAGQTENAPTSAFGSLTISAPDGVASIVIEGVTVFENGALTGSTVSTDEGVLTVTGFDTVTGELKFKYELTGSTTEHDASGMDDISHDLTVTVTDTDGTEVDSSITVNVVDDVPTASADNISFTEFVAQSGTAGGNVLDNDKFGADGAAEQAVTSVKHGNTEGTVGSALEGAYGKLTLNADGSYTYQLNPGMDVPKDKTWTEEFTYTITDADGDTSETTLIITIEGNGDIPVVTVATPEPGEANIMVDEGGQPEHGGEGHAQSGSGSFTVQLNGEDGVITVGGESGWKVTVTGNSADVTGSVVKVNGVAVTVTEATLGTDGKWTVSYDYALTVPQKHGADNSPTDETLTGEIAISVTDATGDTGSGTLTVQVHDDVPVASADNVTLTEAQAQAGGSGENVLTNDVFGADAPADKTVTSIEGGTLGQPVKGQHGELTLNADGTYTYKLNSDVDVPNGDTVTETFTYTITDTDGDTSKATLTITISGDTRTPEVTVATPEPGEANIMVDEGALDGGSGQHTEHGVSNTGSFTVNLNGEDGTITLGYGEQKVELKVEHGQFSKPEAATITVNGVEVTVTDAAQNEDGSWTVNYSYALQGNQPHKDADSSNYYEDELSGTITVDVEDATGDSAVQGTITVEVHDDGPVAYDNVNSVTENASVSGNVLTDGDSTGKTDSFGADGGSGVTWNLSGYKNQEGGADGTYTVTDGVYTVYTQYGVATLNPDGSYTFAAKADAGLPSGQYASVGFGYTIKDSEGDSADANLTITVSGDTRTPEVTVATPEPGEANIMVDEGGQPEHGGEGHAQSGSGSFTVQLNGEDGVITVGGESGWKVTVTGNSADVTGSVVTVNGVAVTVTGATLGTDGTWTVSYDYALTGSQMHGADNSPTDETLTGEIAISVTDATGDTGSGTLTVQVHDDVPELTVTDNQLNVESTTRIEVGEYKLTHSADGDTVTINGEPAVEENGKYTVTLEGIGTVTLENGKVYVQAEEGYASQKNVTLTIKVTDADNDSTEGSVSFAMTSEIGSKEVTVTTDDTALREAESTSATVNASEVLGSDWKFDASQNLPEVPNGNLSVDDEGNLVYTQTEAYTQHGNPDDGNESANVSNVTVTVVNTVTGATQQVQVSVNIRDDAPEVTVAGVDAVLRVDESYADGSEGPGLEISGSAHSDTATLNASDLFSVNAGADGEKSSEYTLSISEGSTGQKVLVDGKQYDLNLVQNEDGSISGVAGDGHGTVIFSVVIDKNSGKITLDMTGAGSLMHPVNDTSNFVDGAEADDHDEEINIGGVKVTLTVKDNDDDSDSASVDLNLTFEDDGPGFSVTTDKEPDISDGSDHNLASGESFSFIPDTPEKPEPLDYENDAAYQAALQKYNEEMDQAKSEAAQQAGKTVDKNILSGNWEGVTIYAGKVTYKEDGTVDTLKTPYEYELQYSNYAGSRFELSDKPAADWGIMVVSPDDDYDAYADDHFETNVIDGNASEAIVIDLGEQLAYGVELSLGAFYSNYHGKEGAEKALVTFYRGNEIVGSRFIDSVDVGASGTAKVTISTEFISDGFDMIVISAVEGGNGRESSFTLQGVDFITAPEAISVTTGEVVNVDPGADGYAEDFAVANVQFAMEQMFGDAVSHDENGNPQYSLDITDGSGEEKSAVVTVITDDSGNSRLTATVEGEEVFSAMLEKDENSDWSWKVEQYQGFQILGKDGAVPTDFHLEFITKDGDGDILTQHVVISLEDPAPILTVSNTELVTDESYIPDVGSQEAPEGEEGDSASSYTDHGTLTVNTLGHAGTLVLTIGSSEYRFGLTDEGKLTASQAVPTSYGQLTLSNGADGIDYTYVQTTAYKHVLDTGIDEKAQGESFKVSVEVGERSSKTSTITVTIEDDAPVFSENSNPYTETSNSEDYWSYSGEISFGRWDNASGLNYWNSREISLGDDSLTFQVGKVTFDDDRRTVNGAEDGWLQFVSESGVFHVNNSGNLGIHTDGWGSVDRNLFNAGANSGRIDEIGYDFQGNQAEAVIIQLGKTALNMNIKVTDFFSSSSGEGVEQAVFLFYKGDKLVSTQYLVSDKSSGNVEQNGFNEMPGGGFDTVVIAAVHNGESSNVRQDNSEFNIEAITFNKFDNPTIRTLTGDLNAVSADGVSYSIDVEALEKLELTCGTNDHLELAYTWDATKNVLTATGGKDGSVVFEVALDTDTGAWTMVQYEEFHGELKLPFIATDGDGDESGLNISIDSPDAENSFSNYATVQSYSMLFGSDEYADGVHDDITYGDADSRDGTYNSNDIYSNGDDFTYSIDDYTVGGSGNDIIVYDKNDYLVDGGSGIDIMVHDGDLTMDSLLSGKGTAETGPIVHGVEVLITGKDALSLTSMDQLARDYGVTINAADNTLTLDMTKWEQDSETGTFDYIGQDGADLTLETNLPPATSTTADADAQTQVFILNNSNGG